MVRRLKLHTDDLIGAISELLTDYKLHCELSSGHRLPLKFPIAREPRLPWV